MDKTTEQQLTKILKLHAAGMNLPEGAAATFISATIASVKKSLASKTIITQADLTRLVTKELKKYNKDFAYIYENCDTII